ncbi:hypothetical protein CAPTEDRAFT_138243 [Capitella teleta]|uniref:Rho-GAP domain-containing protein n=1 Tax=Capitella teleta TaxID=283909 RepID=R7U0A5_CAPTE|nr:hypothetical protein CAPTEDRAFT_138243 [Capitella teleta]|eukprot:ELT99638.1 hypothetical protein CAPTEDRAFT_138243 [Capitella teleta]
MASTDASAKHPTNAVRVKKMMRIYEGDTKFPKLEECHHFHYDVVELGSLQLGAEEDQENRLSAPSPPEVPTEEHVYSLQVTADGQNWTIRRSLANLRLLDRQLHRCIFDRKYSMLQDLETADSESNLSVEEVRALFSRYLFRLSAIAGNMINCGPILSWLEMDNRGNHLMVTDDSAINTPAIAAAHVTKRYTARAPDEISFEVGDIISLIDMPPKEETMWWRGKRNFEVGFFPCDYVEVIGETLPETMASQIPQTPPKPVLRKRGKLISFLRTFFSNRPARTQLKRTGIVRERVFACDLGEHLLNSGLEVPRVLTVCAEAIETHGIQDGIYRLSGLASNIQKLRNAFDEEQDPQLTEELYLQDVHCISSVLKAYFRELPNPLLTYQLYSKFAEAIQDEENKLLRIHDVVQQLPPPHYRTCEYLLRHLSRVGSHGGQTGMHVKNIAIVWAPNLLRSKELEMECTSTAALQGVCIQAVVTEFLISYVDLLFSDKLHALNTGQSGGESHRTRPKSLAISTPTKLLSLEEARERALSTGNHFQKYIEVGGGPSNLPETYHTVIELPGSK